MSNFSQYFQSKSKKDKLKSQDIGKILAMWIENFSIQNYSVTHNLKKIWIGRLGRKIDDI